MALSENYIIQNSTLVDIADAIREKTGSSEKLSPSDMATEIEALGSGTATIKVAVRPMSRSTRKVNGKWRIYANLPNDFDDNSQIIMFFFHRASYSGGTPAYYVYAPFYDNNIYKMNTSSSNIGYTLFAANSSSDTTAKVPVLLGPQSGLSGSIDIDEGYINIWSSSTASTSDLYPSNNGYCIYLKNE